MKAKAQRKIGEADRRPIGLNDACAWSSNPAFSGFESAVESTAEELLTTAAVVEMRSEQQQQ